MVKKWVALMVMVMLVTQLNVWAQDPQYPADERLSFPQDHYLHLDADVVDPNAYIEWLYYTGVMEESSTGDPWGFQITLFAFPLMGQLSFVYEVALSDTQNAVFWHQRGLGFGSFGEGAAIFDDGSFQIAYLEEDGWSIRYTGETNHYETGDIVPINLEITLLNDGSDYIFNSEDGLVAMGNLDDCAIDKDSLDGYSWYYSQPNMPTTMQVSLGDASYEMAGLTWFDHQWGNFADCTLAWNWWGLRLDDGTNLILTQILDENRQVLPGLPSGAIYYPDGTAQFLNQEDVVFEVLREWENPRNGLTFPLEWRITTSDSTLTLVPYFDDQTLPATPLTTAYWEGIMRILDENGEQIGRGYLEVLPQSLE